MGSPINMVTSYGLDNQGMGVRSPAQTHFIHSPSVHTACGVHLVSNPMNTGGSFSLVDVAKA